METKTYLERIVELESEVEILKSVVSTFEENSKKANGVNSEMRKKYTPSGELAILRKTLNLALKALGVSYDEFTEYNNWAESHKAKVKEEIAKQEEAIKE